MAKNRPLPGQHTITIDGNDVGIRYRIELQAILEDLGGRALRRKSRRATAMQGRIVVSVPKVS